MQNIHPTTIIRIQAIAVVLAINTNGQRHHKLPRYVLFQPSPAVLKSPSRQYQLSKEEQEIENFGNVPKNAVSGTASGPEPFTLSGEQVTISKRWLLRPVSRSDKLSMKCYIERERQGFALPTIYRCYLETPTDLTTATHSADRERGPQIPARFMMSAKKRASKKNNSYYLISLDLNPSDDKGSESVLGKVRSNNVGSRYLITDNGLAPDKTAAPSMLRKVILTLT